MDTPGAPRQAATPLATEEVRRRSPLPLILTLVALLAIGVVAILALISSQQGQAVVTPSAIAALGTSTAPTAAVSPLPSATPSASPFTTETANAIHAQSESETAAALTALATATPVPSETALPTATRTPSLSPVPPTATAIPHTSTPIPPSVTPQAVALALPTRQAVTTRVFEDINDGRLDDALTRVAPYREQFPEDPDLKLLEAFALLQFADDSTRLETARTTVESVLSADPKNGAAHFILGLYHRADPVSDPDKAAREFDLAIQNGFAIADVYWARANINRYRDVPKADVLQDFRRALELAPDNDSILIDRGIMLMYDMLDPLAALQDFEASYALVPAPWKHDLLAVAYLKLDRADDAFALYEQGAAGEVANEPHYLADGAFVALAADHPDIARQWAEKALDLNPQENDARQVLGLVAANAGDYQAALDQLGRVTPGADGQPFLNWLFSHDLKEDRARITAQMGNTDEALTLYEQVVNDFGAWWASPYLALGNLYLDTDDTEKAREYFARALEAATNMRDSESASAAEAGFTDVQILEALLEADKLLTANNAQGTLDLLSTLIGRVDPQWPDVYILMGRAQGELGQYDAARESLSRARAIAEAEGEADALAQIDEAERQLVPPQPPTGEGTPDERIDALEAYIDASGTQDIKYYIELAMLYRGVDDTGAARQTLMRGLAMLTTSGNDADARQAVLDALGTLNQPAGPTLSDDPDQRIDQLEQYTRDNQPHEVHWYIDLATLYRERGEVANARRALMRGLAMLTTSGNDPDARQAVLDALGTLNQPAGPQLSDDPDKRIEQLEQYIRDNQPREVHWYIDLAALYRERGEVANARRALMRALAMLTTTGNDPDARQAVLDALNRLDEPSAPPEQPDLRQLIEEVEARIAETSSTNVDDYLELADLYLKAERPPFARRTLLRALHMLWGIEADAGTHQRVREALHRIDPPPFERRSDDPAAIRSDLTRYIEYWLPASELPYLELATHVQAAGDPGQARWVLLRALEMQTLIGGSADVQRHVLDMLRQIEVRGGPDASPDLPSRIGDLEAFIPAKNPNDADLYLELAALYRVQGDDDASRRTLMRALEMLDTTGNNELRVRVTEALRSLDVPLEPSGPRVDDPQAQIDALRRFIDEEKPQDVKPYLELAALYRDQGDTASARRTLMRALAMLTTSGGGQDERNAVLDALSELR